MKLLDGKVLSILPLSPEKAGLGGSSGPARIWRLSLSYPGPETVYEVELQEPLKDLVIKKTTVALNGFVEFDLCLDPHISAGEHLQIAAYAPGEKS